MWLRVEFKCDGKKVDVPISFLKDSEIIQEELQKKEIRDKYYVFWSPREKDTPKSVLKLEGRLLIIDKVVKKTGTKANQLVAGYYESVLIGHASTLEELLALMNKPESRKAKRANTSNCDANDSQPISKRAKNKKSRELLEKARQVNLNINTSDSTVAISNNETQMITPEGSSDTSEVADPPARRSARPKKMKVVQSSDEESALDSDHDPEVVPASKLTHLANEVNEKKEDIKNLKVQIKNLCEELMKVREEKERKCHELKCKTESLEKCQSECDILKAKVNNLTELNMKWQEKELSRSSKSHSSTSRRHSSSSHRSERTKDSPAVRKVLFEIESNGKDNSKREKNESSLKSPNAGTREEPQSKFELNELQDKSPLGRDKIDIIGDLAAQFSPSTDFDALLGDESDLPSGEGELKQLQKVDVKEADEHVGGNARTVQENAPETAAAAFQHAPVTTETKELNTQKKKPSKSKSIASRGGVKMEEAEYTLKAPEGELFQSHFKLGCAVRDGMVPQISFQTFMNISNVVKMGADGDSQFVKNLCDQLWTKEEMAGRSVTGNLCVSIEGKAAKPECTPAKKRYLADLLRVRVDHEIVPVEEARKKERTSEGNIKVILRSKLKTVAASASN